MYLSRLDKIIVCILTAIILLGIYSTYVFHKIPLEQKEYISTAEYVHAATYHYMILVKPSILYENRTFIQKGETAFIPLTKQAVITLIYSITSTSSPSNVNIESQITSTLEAPNLWKKTYITTITPSAILLYLILVKSRKKPRQTEIIHKK